MIRELDLFLTSLPENPLVGEEMCLVAAGDAPADPMDFAFCSGPNIGCNGNGNDICIHKLCDMHVGYCVLHTRCGNNPTHCDTSSYLPCEQP